MEKLEVIIFISFTAREQKALGPSPGREPLALSSRACSGSPGEERKRCLSGPTNRCIRCSSSPRPGASCLHRLGQKPGSSALWAAARAG